MEDHRTVTRLMTENCFMCSIDLQDAYFLISIHSDFRKYLRFEFDGTLYEYNCLPFGLNIAPLVFTKLMKPVLNSLRSQGFRSVAYLDDILLLGPTSNDCLTNVRASLDLFLSLGFLPNYNKCKLVPSQTIEYLGFLFDSRDMSISPAPAKAQNILQLVKAFSQLKHCSIRQFAMLLGKLTSVCPGVRYGWLYTKLLERQKFLALRHSNQNFNAKMSLPEHLSSDFSWWIQRLPTAKNYIRSENYALEIFSDASNTGWGISCANGNTGGSWTVEEQQHHINYRELQAVFFGLKCFAAKLSNCNILCRVDNTTAMAYINKMGSVQFPKLNALARDIWQWCEQRNLFLYASYIKSLENREADRESRSLAKETEWSLSKPAFDQITKRLGIPEIDLFASRNNAKCNRFVSWRRDPESVAVDAFTLNWHKLRFYAFPPFSMIFRVLNKIIADKARGMLVVPLWPSQPWYPVFLSLLEDIPITLQPSKTLLSFNRTPHPLWKKITLVAGTVSWKH